MASPDSKNNPSTKGTLMAAATRLFATQGINVTSIREITKEAGANLASVNYHFGSKDGLIAALIKHHFEPINERRIHLLNEAEARSAPNPAPFPEIWDAFMLPLLEMKDKTPEEYSLIIKLLMRFMSETMDSSRMLMAENYTEVARRFRQAAFRSMPQLSIEDVCWRMHLAAGSMLCALAYPKHLELMSEGRMRNPSTEEMARQLKRFVNKAFDIHEDPVPAPAGADIPGFAHPAIGPVVP